jgi:hypothetical protein
MDPAVIFVPALLIISIAANLMLSSYLRRKHVKRIELLEYLRPWLTERVGRLGARRYLRSYGDFLDLLPDETLQELLDAAPHISEPELLELINSIIDLTKSAWNCMGTDNE